MTNSLLSEYLAPLSELPSECQHKLKLIGELLHESRNAALVFKKNAGKLCRELQLHKSRHVDSASRLGCFWRV